MATTSRVTPWGWEQGDDSSTSSRVTPGGWEQVNAVGGGSFNAAWARGRNEIIRSGAMKKNVASQKIGAQMVSATDGSAFTGAVTVYVTIDAGTQAAGSVGAGACTHEGNGYHTYAPAQAETNGDLVAFTFVGTGAVPASVQVYTSFPQTGDAYAEATNVTYGLSAIETLVDGLESTIGTPAGASVSADMAAIKAETAAIVDDTGTSGVVVAAASKSGYSLTATTGLGNQTADITGSLSGSVGSVTGSVGGNVTGSVGSVAAGGITASSIAADAIGASELAADAVAEIAAAVLTTQMTEAYRANGAAPTLAQAQFEVLAHLGESSISGTTKTIKKIDHSTTAETFTLDDATTPTSITRAT